MIDNNTLQNYLIKKFPEPHTFTNNKLLYGYVMELKNRYLKKSAPLSNVVYDDKVETLHKALGLHTYHSKVHGEKVKIYK